MGGVGGVGGLAMILVGSPGALLVLYWHSPLLLSMATPGQPYFPALLAMAILLTRSVDDLGARVRAPVLALALETVLVADPVAVLLVELLAADVLGELRSPVGVRLLVRQAW